MPIWLEVTQLHALTVVVRLKQSFICMWSVTFRGISGNVPENGTLTILELPHLLSYQVPSCLDLRRSNLRIYLTFSIVQGDIASFPIGEKNASNSELLCYTGEGWVETKIHRQSNSKICWQAWRGESYLMVESPNGLAPYWTQLAKEQLISFT